MVSLVLLGFNRTRCGIALFGFWTAEFDLKAAEGFPTPSKDLEPALKYPRNCLVMYLSDHCTPPQLQTLASSEPVWDTCMCPAHVLPPRFISGFTLCHFHHLCVSADSTRKRLLLRIPNLQICVAVRSASGSMSSANTPWLNRPSHATLVGWWHSQNLPEQSQGRIHPPRCSSPAREGRWWALGRFWQL